MTPVAASAGVVLEIVSVDAVVDVFEVPDGAFSEFEQFEKINAAKKKPL